VPRLAPKVGAGMAGEVTGEVDDALKSARKFLDAAATSKLMEGVKNVADGNGSSAAIKDLGEVTSAVASSMKSTGELQASLISQMADLAKRDGSSDNGEIKSLMDRIMMIKMIEALGPQRQGMPPEVKELIDQLREENRRLAERMEKLEERRGPSPMEEQMQSLTMQLWSQKLADLMNPFSSLERVAEAKGKLKDLLGEPNSVPPEYSEGALRAKAIEKEIEAIRVEENVKLRELDQKKEMYSQVIPKAAETIAGALSSLADKFGLAPVQPPRFSQEAVAEAEAMAGGS